MLCTLSNLRESSGQVSGSTPLLSKYCPVVTEVKTGKPIHQAACFPHCCAAPAKRTLLAGSSTQTRCVEYFISRDIIGEEAGTTSFKYMIRYARTGPALATQHGLDIGWSTTCDREYTVVVHINVVMFRGSFQCETPSRHVYTMNISHQTACSAILVGFLHASNRYDTWCKYFASNCSQKISFLRFLAHPASMLITYSSEI